MLQFVSNNNFVVGSTCFMDYNSALMGTVNVIKNYRVMDARCSDTRTDRLKVEIMI